MGNESCAVSGWSVRFHVPGINAQARRKVEGTSFANILRIPPKRVKPISPYETGRPRPTPEHYRHSGFPFRHPRLLPPLSSSPSPPSVILDISNRGSRVFCMYTRAIPWRHLRAPLVLGPFAETKGPRRAGPKPRKNLSPFCHPGLDPGSRALLVFSVVGAASNAARPPCSPGPCGLPTLSLWEMAGVRRAGGRGGGPLNDVERAEAQPFGVTVKRRVPMRVTSLASYPTKISTR